MILSFTIVPYSCILEWLCTILSGALAMPVGSAVFITLFYHPLHDWFNIHSEVPVLMWITAIFVIVWISDRNPASDSRTPDRKSVVKGKSVDLGGRRIIKKKTSDTNGMREL